MSAVAWTLCVLGAAAAVVVLATVVVLARRVMSLERAVLETGADLARLREEAGPLLAETRAALRRAESANRRTDALLDTATSVTETVDAATKLAHRVVGSPVVKLMSWGTGARRAVRRLRGGSVSLGARRPAGRGAHRPMGVAEARAQLQSAERAVDAQLEQRPSGRRRRGAGR